MTLASWHEGVIGGLYGRLASHIGTIGLGLLLSVPAALLIWIGWRLRQQPPTSDTDSEASGSLEMPA
ncbi:hypothetical protein [Methylobacterium sp. 391_Methyba4]|uniref:hypothetical protein n=1 Tax=Methylobacterium sp. 391_Methyba4 TaxID=3038924 RepID=UPI00241C50FA|nr:hypothetical protein [Methylobacterium sp. 391_Methyba4]WFS09130.1 hypothetical protein P9K36_07530 [Methylobacterium sp. 391_Methyba4]